MSFQSSKSNRVRNAALVAAAASAVLAAAPVRAATIAYWNFNDSNTTVDAGTGALTVTTAVAESYGTGTTVNATSGTVAGNAIRVEAKSNANPSFTFSASTASLSDIWFSYATSATSGSFTLQTIAYSTNGTTFTNLAQTVTPGTSFSAAQFDLSGIAGLNNNANAKFRVSFSAPGSNGNNMFTNLDNVQINSGNDSQITAAASLNLGRVMQNGAGAQNFNLNKAGFLSTSYTASGTGLAVTADGAIGSGPGTETISVGLANDASGSATTGLKALSLTIDNTGGTSFGAGLGSADANDSVNVSATVVANRVVSAGDISLGRVMVGQTLSGSSSLSTTGDDNNFTRVTVGTTAAADANGFSLTGGTGTLFNSAASTGARNAGGSFSTSGLKSGSRTLTTTGEGLAGEAPVNVTVNYTGTALANRVVSAGSVNFGTVIVGGSVSDASSLTTLLDDDNATRVSVATTAGPDSNGVSITGGTGTSFNGAASTGTRNLAGTLGTAGNVSGSLMLTTTGEGLAGESPIDVSVAYSATALDHSNGSFATPADTDTIVIDFGVVPQNSTQSLPFSIHNLLATAGFTAGLDLDSIFETDPDGVFSSDLATFANLAAGGSSAYSVALDTTNAGTFGGSYVLSLSDQNLAGATGGQLLTINVIGEVVPEPAGLGLLGAAAVMGLARRRRRTA